MSREMQVADHWTHANVVQELGWRPRLARLPLPRWRREKVDAAPRDPGEARLLVLFDVLNCVFLAWVTSLLGLYRMSDGSLPWEWVFPALAAVSAGLIAWLKGLRWPPVPEWERYSDVAPDEEDLADDDIDTEDETVEEDVEPLTVREVLWMILLTVLFTLLAVGAAGLFLAVCVALLAGFVVRRGWPALVVVALLAAVAPYASAGEVRYTLFAAFAIAMLFNCFLVWPLQRWCGLPNPVVGRSKGEAEGVEEVASTW